MRRARKVSHEGDARSYRVRAALRRHADRHLVVSLAVEVAASDVFPDSAPLLKEKWNLLFPTRPKDLSNPFDFHWSSAPSGFPTNNHPVNIRQIDARRVSFVARLPPPTKEGYGCRDFEGG